MEKTDAKRLAGNTVTLFVRMVLVLIVTLYSSRVVLRTLGFDDFGIIRFTADANGDGIQENYYWETYDLDQDG